MFISCFVTEQYLLQRKYRKEKIEITVVLYMENTSKQNKIFLSISTVIII